MKTPATYSREHCERLRSAGGRRVIVELDLPTLAALQHIRQRDGHKTRTAAIIAAIVGHANRT